MGVDTLQHGPNLAPHLYWNTAIPTSHLHAVLGSVCASRQSSVVTTETIWHSKPKIFTSGPLQKKFVGPCLEKWIGYITVGDLNILGFLGLVTHLKLGLKDR